LDIRAILQEIHTASQWQPLAVGQHGH
jgi:hypothetical protein